MMDPEQGRVLDPLCENRFPHVAIYRRKKASTLLESVELDLDDDGYHVIARVQGSDRSWGRGVLEISTRGLQVSNAAGDLLRVTSWRDLCARASGVLLRARTFIFAPGVSFPIRSLWNLGDSTGFVFESTDDYQVLSRAVDELAPLLALHGAATRKGATWHRVDLPEPAIKPA